MILHLVSRKKRGRDVQILHIIDFIPLLIRNRQCLQRRIMEIDKHPENLLIVLIVAHHLAVRLQERHILVPAKLFAELINVHRLVVLVRILVAESLFRYEIHDSTILVDAHHRPVHPALVLRDQCQIRIRMGQQQVENPLFENQV